MKCLIPGLFLQHPLIGKNLQILIDTQSKAAVLYVFCNLVIRQFTVLLSNH